MGEPQYADPRTEQEGGTHYLGMVVQPYEFAVLNAAVLNFVELNIIKYVSRHKYKNGAQDIRKAMHTIRWLLAWRYGENLHPREYPLRFEMPPETYCVINNIPEPEASVICAVGWYTSALELERALDRCQEILNTQYVQPADEYFDIPAFLRRGDD